MEHAAWLITVSANWARFGQTYETWSPDKRWAAYVKEHNLYLRDTVTGTVLQLTQYGTHGVDYATPLPSLGMMVDKP